MTAASGAAWRQARHRGKPLTPGQLARRTGFFLLLAIFVVISLFPFYWIVDTSLKTPQAINAGTTSLLPGHITLATTSTTSPRTTSSGRCSTAS